MQTSEILPPYKKQIRVKEEGHHPIGRGIRVSERKKRVREKLEIRDKFVLLFIAVVFSFFFIA